MVQSPLFSTSLDLSLSGSGAVAAADLDAALTEAGAALKQLSKALDPATLALLRMASERDDLMAAQPIAARLLEDTSEIFVFGIGGAGAGAQALLGLSAAAGPRISIVDNLDPFSLSVALQQADLKTTKFVTISKGGTTIESLAQSLAAVAALEAAGRGDVLRDHFVVITEPGPRSMRAFAQSIGCPVIDHPPNIGGRYSMLTIAGLFPLLLTGQSAVAVREGAAAVLVQALSGKPAKEIPAAAGAALHLALHRVGKLRETILWSYSDRLEPFNAWWRQLWAESLGKGGLRTTPIAALGPVDQHSQLRLFFDNPGVGLVTLMALDTKGAGPRLPADRAAALGFQDLASRTIGDLVAAQVRATAETLNRQGRPVRHIHLHRLDERSIGALFMHFMLEVLLLSRMLGVDPFDSPVITEHKPLARKYLAAY